MPTTNIQTIILKPGECIYLPKDADILSLINDDGLDLISDCLDFNIPPQVCANFVFSIEDVDGDNFDDTDGATIESVFILGSEYPVGFVLMNPAGTSVVTGPVSNVMNIAGITSSTLTSAATGSQRTYTLAIQMPSRYVNEIEIKLSFSTGRWPNGLYIKPSIDPC